MKNENDLHVLGHRCFQWVEGDVVPSPTGLSNGKESRKLLPLRRKVAGGVAAIPGTRYPITYPPDPPHGERERDPWPKEAWNRANGSFRDLPKKYRRPQASGLFLSNPAPRS